MVVIHFTSGAADLLDSFGATKARFLFGKDEPYSLKLEEGAVLIILESIHLLACERPISTPHRIAGATGRLIASLRRAVSGGTT
jgi:hypothetical protein